MNYYNEIKDRLTKNEIRRKIREYYINKNDLTTYYEVGKLLSMAGKHYGEGIIKEYSIKLTNELGRKYNVRYLYDMRRLYHFIKVHPVGAQLTMSHFRILFSLKDNKEYQRIPSETRNKLINQDKAIGIIVCRENNKYLIKYSSDSRIHAVTYEIV